MTIEEFNMDFQSFIQTLFQIEKGNLPRSSFAGIRDNKGHSTGALKNSGFKYTYNLNSGRIENVSFTLDSSTYKYAQYINELPNMITQGYWEKIQKDIAQRIASRYSGVIVG